MSKGSMYSCRLLRPILLDPKLITYPEVQREATWIVNRAPGRAGEGATKVWPGGVQGHSGWVAKAGEEETGEPVRVAGSLRGGRRLGRLAAVEKTLDEGDVPFLPIEPEPVGRRREESVLVHEAELALVPASV